MILKCFSLFLLISILCSCGNNNSPDVSAIPANVSLIRFEKFLFEKLDTNRISEGINEMHKAYPFFAHDFLTNILGLPDIQAPGDSIPFITSRELKRFITLTKPLYDSLHFTFEHMDQQEKELKKAFQHVKYYFPSYNIPRLFTYIGPFDAPAVAVTGQGIAIGLQLFAGKDFSFYASNPGQELYPRYISRRFEPAFITPSVMNAVIQDMFPDKSQGKPMIEQMVMKGKEWWLLDKFLPGVADSIKTGYTEKQLGWAKQNEGVIWNFFLQNNDLYTTEPAIIKNYIGEAPHTDGMPDQSPGNIGQWVGWQIVTSYAEKHPDLKPADIMKVEPRKIFSESQYKPR